jgi:hypothetical protein
MTCECYQIGGRFIAEDPDCSIHGYQAQYLVEDRADMWEEVDRLLAVLLDHNPSATYVEELISVLDKLRNCS